MIPVVAAVLRDADGRLFVGRRPSHKRHGDLWEFPGGKVDPGETVFNAVRRELDEELGLETLSVSGPPLFQRQDPGQPFHIQFLAAQASGAVRLMEHSEVAWLNPASSADFALAPTDAAFVAAVASGEVDVSGIPISNLD